MIHNPSNLYFGNAVTLDTSPMVKFATHLMAERQAREDALNKYNADQLSKINPQGMRDQEIPALLAAKDDLQKFYQAHSREINHPTPKNMAAYQEYQRKWNLANQIMYSSKNASKTSKEIAKVKESPDKIDRLTNGSLQSFDRQAAPAYIVKDGQVVPNEYDPANNPNGYEPFDMNFHFNPKEYTAQQLESLYGNYGKGLTPANQEVTSAPVVNPDGTKSKYSILQTTKSTYTPEQLKQVGEAAKAAYQNDNSLAYTFSKNNPFDITNPEHTANFDQLNQVYKKVTGNDIKDQSDLYAASVIARKSAEAKVASKVARNEDALFNDQTQRMKQMEAIRNQHSIDRLYTAANLKQNKDNQTDVEDADAVLKDVYDNINSGIQNNTAKGLKGFLGMKPTEGPIEVSDPNVIKDFSSVRKVGSTPMPPDKVLFDTKKDQFSLYYAPIHFYATNSSPAMDIPATTIPMSGRDYIKLKVKETYPNRDIGNINRIVDKVITEKGGLYNAVKDIYGNSNNTQSQSKPIQLSGKVDPAQLRVNQAYNVNGKTYIWDGKKLKAQ